MRGRTQQGHLSIFLFLACIVTATTASVLTCSAKLSDLCPPATESMAFTSDPIQACSECARSNEAELLSAGCTVEFVTKICKTRVIEDPVTPEDAPIPETVLPTGSTPSNPLRVFVQSGQSGCVGQASAKMMNIDDNPSYDELKGTQEGVWFSGLKGGTTKDASRFYMGPMIAGEASAAGNKFGPEVSVGRRLSDAKGDSAAPVLIIKYCWGGSNVEKEWNPRTSANSWDREKDNGTALWLLNESGGATDLSSKNHLYANLIYTVRRSLEVLHDGGIPYELSGLFWIQGSADKKRTWRQYGEDLGALFEAIRTDLGEPDLPIVDSGSAHHNIITGKVYAGSIINGCNTVLSHYKLGMVNPDDTECILSPSNPCLESTFIDFDVLNYYGYDPVMHTPEYSYLKPTGASNETFFWFKAFPSNQHAEYEGAILMGQMMANAYVRSFTDDELLVNWVEDDIGEKFPSAPCNPDVNGGKPSADNVCWMDQREETDLAEATCPDINKKQLENLSIISSSGATKGRPFIFLVSSLSAIFFVL